MTGETWSLGRRHALDGVRGIAIVMVVAAHAAPGPLPAAGAAGVSVFFALSGFLITSLLLDEVDRHERIDLWAFYGRRARRLFPALAVFLAFLVTVHVFVGPVVNDWRHLLGALLYVGNWFSATGNPMGQADHTWSLAVEEQFYLLFPLLVVALVGRSRRALVLTVAGLAVASVSLRLGLVWAGATANRVYNGTDTVACLLLAGCLTALVVRRWRPARPHGALAMVLFAVIGVLGLVPEVDGARTLVPIPAAVLTCVAIWLVMADESPRGVLVWRPLRLAGQRSYALYLWHFPVVMFGADLAEFGYGANRWIAVPILVAVSWGIAALSWRYVEEPFLKKRASAPSVTQPAT